jgi:hypothetical protein
MNTLKNGLYRPFQWQAAGHDVLTLLNDEILCKPIALHPNQLDESIEARWYLALQSHNLNKMTPKFYGFMQLPVELEVLVAQGSTVLVEKCLQHDVVGILGTETCLHTFTPGKVYLLMLNVMTRYKEPNLIDLKLGHRLFDDFCTNEKRLRATALANKTTSTKVGVRLCGMQRWNGKRWRWKREFGRQLTEDALPRAVRSFFCHMDTDWNPLTDQPGWVDTVDGIGQELSHVRLEVLKQLKEIFSAVQQLDNVRIYSSSVLICYEGFPGLPSQPIVYMIDFAHAYFGQEGRDENYLSGLTNLITMLT